jgi:glutathione S-transferase
MDEHPELRYLAINPNGKLPSLQDGPVTMWESMAINLYLAQTIASPLSPANNRELADVFK